LKDEIKSRLLNGEKFSVPRRCGKTQAIVELLAEHGDRFVAVLPNQTMADQLMKRYQEYNLELSGTWECDGLAKCRVRSIKGNQPFPVEYYDYLADELYMFPIAPFFLYGGVGTLLTQNSQMHVPEPGIMPYVPSNDEEFAWHFEPRS
jgi:hypothetical protein